MKVMIIDDDDDIREITVLSLLMDPEIEARGFPAALPAIERLRAGDWKPDLVLLDVMMADVDGLAALAMIRDVPGCADLPVVFMTARSRSADQAALVDAGARAVITKPFAVLELASEVRRLAQT